MSPPPPVALITGGHGTLARAVAAELSAAGWEVRSPGRQDLDDQDSDSVRDLFAGLSRLDLLVNAAGLCRDAAFSRLTEEDFDTVVSANLRGAWLCARAAFSLMVPRSEGHIVNIGSRTALHGVAGQSAYGAAKAGLLSLTQSLADEGGPHGIRVNAVLPGWMPTALNQDVAPERHEAVRREHRLGRFNTPGDTARFILFLHSLPHTSGQIFQLDSRPGLWL